MDSGTNLIPIRIRLETQKHKGHFYFIFIKQKNCYSRTKPISRIPYITLRNTIFYLFLWRNTKNCTSTTWLNPNFSWKNFNVAMSKECVRKLIQSIFASNCSYGPIDINIEIEIIFWINRPNKKWINQKCLWMLRTPVQI